MTEINFNDNNLTNNQIDKIKRKVRAFVINECTNQVLLVRYAGLYMLPGGSIDNDENETTAIQREILEEAGIEIDIPQITPFLVINSYDANYYDRKSGKINRLTQTIFFKVFTSQNVDESKKSLTESEKEMQHDISFVDINDIETMVNNNPSQNPKRKQFDRELISALQEFLKLEEKDKQIDIKAPKQLKN